MQRQWSCNSMLVGLLIFDWFAFECFIYVPQCQTFFFVFKDLSFIRNQVKLNFHTLTNETQVKLWNGAATFCKSPEINDLLSCLSCWTQSERSWIPEVNRKKSPIDDRSIPDTCWTLIRYCYNQNHQMCFKIERKKSVTYAPP